MKYCRFTALILAVLIGISALMLPSCSDKTADNSGTKESTSASTDSVADTTAEITPNLPERDLEGREFNFYVMGYDRNVNNYSVEIFAAESNGDPITDAVYNRNIKLEDKYNFKITETASPDDNMVANAQKNISAGDDVYQVLMFNLKSATTMTQAGMLYDLYGTEFIDISMPWWDSQIADDISISKKLYYATGDINIMDNNATWAVFFNKKLITDYSLSAPYTYVNDNTWTLDKYLEMAQAVATDVNGNDIMEVDDIWGTVGEAYNAYMLYIAAGERITEKNTDDIPQLIDPTSRTSSVIEKIYAIMLDTDRSTINANDYSSKYNNVFSELIRGNFKSDKALFYIAGLLSYTLLRDMESAYGMVPMPKYDSNQENYYTSLNLNNASTVSIPISNLNPDDTSFILEAMSAESMTTLTPAYYNIALERKYMRDDESAETLEIILDSRAYDLASLYNWGGIYDIFTNMVISKNTDYTSKFDAAKDKAISAIDETITEINKSN